MLMGAVYLYRKRNISGIFLHSCVYRFIGLCIVPLVTLNECFAVESTEGNMEFEGGGLIYLGL